MNKTMKTEQENTERLMKAIFPEKFKDMGAEMIGHVYSNGQHARLSLTVDDLEEFIMRAGWTSVEQIEGMTDAGRERITELEAQEFIESCGGGLGWWDERLIDSVPALTPDA